MVVRITVTILSGFVGFCGQGGEVDAERVGEALEGVDGGGVVAAFETAVVGYRESGGAGHVFLGAVLFVAQDA